MLPKSLGILIMALLLLIVEYYCITAIRLAFQSISPRSKLIATIAYIAISIIHLVLLFTFRSITSNSDGNVFKTILVAFVIGFMVAKLIVVLWMFIDDLRRLVTWIFQNINKSEKSVSVSSIENTETQKGITRSVFLSRLALISGVLIMSSFMFGVRNKYNYRLRKQKIQLANLPNAFKGLKIIHISDIHTGSFDNKEAVETGVKMIMEQKPDLILFTGDLVNNVASEIVPYKDIFSQLKAPMGVYSVLGNHDYGDYVEWKSKEEKAANLETLKQHQAEMGWRLLMNENIKLEKEGEHIHLLGIENWGANMNFKKYGDLSAAYNGLQHTDSVKILMSHDPSHWDAEVRKQFKDINLMLSGHTHGMQFGIDLSWLKWSPIRFVYKQWAGLYKENNQQLYVNRGFGFLGYKGRVGILPEITLIELA